MKVPPQRPVSGTRLVQPQAQSPVVNAPTAAPATAAEVAFAGVSQGVTPRPVASGDTAGKTLANSPAGAARALEQGVRGGDRVFASLDLGSSSVKMLVMAQGANGKLRVLEDLRIGANLGKGVAPDGTIPDANQQRVVDALQKLLAAAAVHGVDPSDVPLIATAAVRNAPNKEAFLHRLRDEVGLSRARVLTGDEEAQTGYRAALLGLENRPAGRYATLDLGGGSFQLAVGTQDAMKEGASTQVGSNQVQEKLLPAAAITAQDFQKADDALKALAPMPLGNAALEGCRFVGMGGVALFLRAQFGRNVVSRAEIEALRQNIGPHEPAQRAQVLLAGVPEDTHKALGVDTVEGKLDYATKLPAKLTLLLHIMRSVGLEELHISNEDARHLLIEQDRTRNA